MIKVFLSSTSNDLGDYRAAVHDKIGRLDGYQCVRMEDFGARSETPEEFCRKRVSECDVFVGILGHVYGSIPEGASRSFTHLEYDAARFHEKPRLMFVAPEGVASAISVQESERQRRAQEEFRREVMENRVVETNFRDPKDLAALVVTALHNLVATPKRAAILERHKADYTTTYRRVAVLGDHPAEVLDDVPDLEYIPRRFDAIARGQTETGPQRLRPERPASAKGADAASHAPSEFHEDYLLALLRVEASWLLVEGEGGSGKTEFARYAAFDLASKMPDNVEQSDRVPVLIECRSIAADESFRSAAALMSAFAEHAGHLGTMVDGKSCFHHLAAEGRLVLILDGMDELSNDLHYDLFDRALEDCGRHFGLDRCAVLVTGRSAAFASTSGLRHRAQWRRFQPQPLQLADIEAYILEFFGQIVTVQQP